MFQPRHFYQHHFRNLEEFYLHNIIRLLALSMFDIFSSIYVFTLLRDVGLNHQQSLGLTALFLAAIFLSHFTSLKIALYLISKTSLQISMFWGNILLIFFSIILYFSRFNLYLLAPAAIICGLYIAFYYTGYHIYFSQLTDDKRQGRELAIGNGLFAAVGILGPILGGFIITLWGFGLLFLVMTIILVISSIPLKLIASKTVLKIDSVNLSPVFKFRKERGNLLAIFGSAAVDSCATYFWPLLIFIVLAGNFISVGILGAVIAGVSIGSSLGVGVLIDKLGPQKIIGSLSLGDSLVWIVRVFSQTPLLASLASVLQALTTHNLSLTLDTMIYEKARAKGSIAPIIQREVGFAISKTTFLALSGFTFLLGAPLVFTFFAASVATLLTKLYTPDY